MRAGAIVFAGSMAAVLACAFAGTPAAAQEQIGADYAYAAPPATPVDDAKPVDAAPPPDENDALGNALSFDPASLAGAAPSKPLRLPGFSALKGLDVSRSDRANGSGTVVVKKPLVANEWDATVGADVNLAATPAENYQLDKPAPTATDNTGSGAAWASIGVPNVASVDARVDPANDQGKLGTTLKRSIPIGSRFAVTLQDTYSVTQTFNPLGPLAETSPNHALLETAPVSAVTPTPLQVWGNERIARLEVRPTGTTFSADLASASNDPVTHKTFSADQKIYGPLHVTTAVTDIGEPTVNKTISAGLKLNW